MLVVLLVPGTAKAVDSLSDAGNVFALTGQLSVRPYNASGIPDAPYQVGGLHLSNGATWIEQAGH